MVTVLLLVGFLAGTADPDVQPWCPKDPKELAGEYVAFLFTGNAVTLTRRLRLTWTGKGWEAAWLSRRDTDREAGWVALQRVRVQECQLLSDGAMAANGPAPLPAPTGRFVEVFPPGNAKGPVERGLLLGGLFLVKQRT